MEKRPANSPSAGSPVTGSPGFFTVLFCSVASFHNKMFKMTQFSHFSYPPPAPSAHHLLYHIIYGVRPRSGSPRWNVSAKRAGALLGM